jgi:hypothetical protein
MSIAGFQRVTGVALTAVLLVAAATGCSSSSEPNATTPPTKEPSAWQSVLGQIKEDGSVSKDTALAAFAVAIGPVPGGTAPAGAADTIPSGTLAVSWVFSHWGELNAGQRAAVFTALGIQAEPRRDVRSTPRNAPAAYTPSIGKEPKKQNPHVPCLKADSAGAEKYRAWVPGIEQAISAKLGRPLTIDKTTYLAVNSKDLAMPALMYTYACEQTNPGNKVTGCTIHINPNAVSGKFDDDMVRSFLIHEYVHCYLFDKFGFVYGEMPAWYLEGAPSWAMSVLGVANDRLSGMWTDYLDTPDKPLTQRSYDGVGFFAHLAETGTDPWSVMDKIGAAMAGGKGTAGGWKAAGVTPSFLDSWGGGPVQGRYPGAAWTSKGPNLPPYTPPLTNASIGDGGTLQVTAKAYASAVRRLDVDASVLLVTTGPGTAGRISLGNGADSPLGAGSPFCTVANCACPADSPGAGTTFTQIAGGQQYLGLTGGNKAGSVAMVGMSLPDFCQKPPQSCLVGRWTGVNFDVHLADITETGGAGVKMHIDPEGNLTVNFNGMKPVVFHIDSGGQDFSGHFVYTGTVSGKIKLPTGGATSGRWDYASEGKISGLRAKVQLDSPVAIDLGTLDLADLASAGGAAGAISDKPVTSGGWTCTGDTLVTTPPPDSEVSGTWTLKRTGPG